MSWQLRLFRTLLVTILLATSLPVALAAADLQRPEHYRMTRPGEVLFVRETRRKELRAMSGGAREALCGKIRESGWPSHGTVRNVRNDKQPAATFALTMMRAGAEALAYHTRSARKIIIRTLARYAQKKALSKFVGKIQARSFYNLDRTLLPTIIAYWIVRDDPLLKKKDRERIDAWLDKVVRMRGPDRVTDEKLSSSRNNHRYLRSSVTMAWGALAGGQAMFRQGIQRFHIALEQMREDGSLPLETNRGARALYYQRHAIASLVTIAEIAWTQGYDLYAERNTRGHTIHDMVQFLADALSDPTRLEIYTTKAQDLTFLGRRGHDRHYMAWLQPYRAHFPEADAIEKLDAAIMQEADAPTYRLDDYSGGMTSCFFGEED